MIRLSSFAFNIIRLLFIVYIRWWCDLNVDCSPINVLFDSRHSIKSSNCIVFERTFFFYSFGFLFNIFVVVVCFFGFFIVCVCAFLFVCKRMAYILERKPTNSRIILPLFSSFITPIIFYCVRVYQKDLAGENRLYQIAHSCFGLNLYRHLHI